MADEKKDDGGPAFPRPAYEIESATRDTVIWGSGQSGMSLRDWFAGKALAGIMAAEADADGGGAFRITDHKEIKFSTFVERFASAAYMLADAMLEARKKGS